MIATSWTIKNPPQKSIQPVLEAKATITKIILRHRSQTHPETMQKSLHKHNAYNLSHIYRDTAWTGEEHPTPCNNHPQTIPKQMQTTMTIKSTYIVSMGMHMLMGMCPSYPWVCILEDDWHKIFGYQGMWKHELSYVNVCDVFLNGPAPSNINFKIKV